MMQKTLGMLMAIMLITWACTNNQKNTSSHDINPTNNTKKMNSYLAIFEIPATDISRAINFYGAILDLKVEKIDLPGMEMGLLPYKDQMVTGVIIKGEGYTPSSSGVTIYLNGGHNLQII